MKKFYSVLFILLTSCVVFSQNINQLDVNGKNHGVWKKNFENTDVLRYEGAFSHGKEIGVFKFYKNIKNKAVLSATKVFNESNDIAKVTFLSSKGKVISEGEMDGKKHIGQWNYYQQMNDNLLTVEHYNDVGNLHGLRTVFYPNEQVAEKQNYKNGKLEGVSVMYSESNVLLSELVYVNGQLHGYSKYYSPKAELIAEGMYENDKKVGIWKFYEKEKLTKEKNFN